MERQQKDTHIELRSAEVQELMGKVPPVILRVGISIVLIFVIAIFVASNMIMYPDIISVPIVARNVNYVAEVKSASSGLLAESNIKHGNVNKGDTLAKTISISGYKQDTVSVISPLSGVEYPCDVLQNNTYIEKNSVLCVVADSIKNRIFAKALVSVDLRNSIAKGMAIESNINNYSLAGKVTNVAGYANPYNGMYAISMEFKLPKELANTIIWNCHANAKIKITSQSIFERFFKGRLVPNF